MPAVRVTARELTALIMDEDRLRSERSDRKLWKSRVSGIEENMHGFGGGYDPGRRERERRERRRRADEEDAEYRLAIEASKAEAEEERKRREKAAKAEQEDEDLAKAIKLSKEEEELRRRELEESNAQSLFDDTPAQPAQPQPTGYNQGYQQQPAVDWFGNPIDPQQPLTTGYLNNQYAQQTGFQSQPTGFQNGFSNGFQMQPTGFDQSQQYGQPQNYFQSSMPLQPQQTAFNNNNPYGNTGFFGQQQQQQQQNQQENYLQPGSNNPWAIHNQQSIDSLKPMPTGSNNPFARPQSQPARTGPPTLSTLSEERATTQFNTHSPNPITNYRAPSPNPSPSKTTTSSKFDNPQYARLNALLANGEGQDTFGNVGELRIPAQHTAPGTFVNSAGQGLDRLRAAQTGNNPFFSARNTGFNQPNNSFGSQQPQQQSGSLIDL